VSSGAGTTGRLQRAAHNGRATTTLDAAGSAPLPRLLTADDVAKILCVPRSFVYALARRGEVPTVRIGDRYVRFRGEAIEGWIDECETTERRGTQ
jgi:excisionase family DNA binding protein